MCWAAGLPETHPIFCKFVPGSSEECTGEKHIVLQFVCFFFKKKSVHLGYSCVRRNLGCPGARKQKKRLRGNLPVYEVCVIKPNVTLFSYKNQFSCAQWQPVWQLLSSQGPFYSTFHSSVGLHPRAGGSSSVLVWGWIRLSLGVLPLGPAVLNTGTEITEVTRGSQESAGREAASS